MNGLHAFTRQTSHKYLERWNQRGTQDYDCSSLHGQGRPRPRATKAELSDSVHRDQPGPGVCLCQATVLGREYIQAKRLYETQVLNELR